MVAEVLIYHGMMVNLFLFTLFINLLVPAIFRNDRAKEIKMTRITFFLYSAMLAMVAFSGTILYMLMKIPWSVDMTLMVVLLAMLAGMEIARSRKLVTVWMEGEAGMMFSWRYVVAEIVLTVVMMFYMANERRDAVPL